MNTAAGLELVVVCHRIPSLIFSDDDVIESAMFHVKKYLSNCFSLKLTT